MKKNEKNKIHKWRSAKFKSAVFFLIFKSRATGFYDCRQSRMNLHNYCWMNGL